MNIFLAGEFPTCFFNWLKNTRIKNKNQLFSYFYLSKSKQRQKYFNWFKKNSERVIIDSGAHTFHTSQNVDFTQFTRNYANFIKKNDNNKVVGYFEMDIDNRIGYKNVLKLRKILEETTDKIIPVWHKNRGFKKFEQMCRNYNYVSISCLQIEGIPDTDLHKFVQIAHDNNCKIHGLGGTRDYIINNVPFDSVDSASWLYPGINKRFNGKKVKSHHCEITKLSYLNWRKKQKFYEKYWNEKRKKLNI